MQTAPANGSTYGTARGVDDPETRGGSPEWLPPVDQAEDNRNREGQDEQEQETKQHEEEGIL